jgi:hypothetical protein
MKTILARPDFVASDAVEFWDVTNREDSYIAELSQAGIRSRAFDGIVAGRTP